MSARSYDTNMLAAIHAMNANVGEVMWYEYYRDEYICAGGRREMCGAMAERIISRWPDCVRWVPYARIGAVITCKIEVMKKIKIEV